MPMNRTGMRIAAAALAALFATVASAGEMGQQSDPLARHHDHHHVAMDTRTVRSIINYRVPDVRLVRDDGVAVNLMEELDATRTVVLSFIYTTCTTICPVASATLAQLQGQLGGDIAKVQMVSISIDPDQDTPSRLTEYGKKFGAGPNWRHYTGTAEASIAVQRAFDAYRGDKMNHTPVTYIRRPASQSWIRLDNFASADELLAECRGLVASK
jgi:protein SCO1/2